MTGADLTALGGVCRTLEWNWVECSSSRSSELLRCVCPSSYFLCYEDIPNPHAEADGISEGVSHGGVVRMWSIGQWVQVDPDPSAEELSDWWVEDHLFSERSTWSHSCARPGSCARFLRAATTGFCSWATRSRPAAALRITCSSCCCPAARINAARAHACCFSRTLFKSRRWMSPVPATFCTFEFLFYCEVLLIQGLKKKKLVFYTWRF